MTCFFFFCDLVILFFCCKAFNCRMPNPLEIEACLQHESSSANISAWLGLIYRESASMDHYLLSSTGVVVPLDLDML